MESNFLRSDKSHEKESWNYLDYFWFALAIEIGLVVEKYNISMTKLKIFKDEF